MLVLISFRRTQPHHFITLQAQPHQGNIILVNAVPQDDSDPPIFIASDRSSSASLLTVDSSQVLSNSMKISSLLVEEAMASP